jgi:phage FluMu gp28-like protein
VACGRRFGKSLLGIDRLIQPALNGGRSAWFSPTYPMLTEIWGETKRILQPVTMRVSAQEHRIELLTGGVVDMWSLENADSVRGRKYHRAILDEAAMVGNLEEAWNAAIRPTLTDYRGDAWLLSTPRGMNFFWKAWTWGSGTDQPEWMSWRMPTSANPFIDAEEIEAARKSLPERVFSQEYLAEFLEDAGGVFRKVRAAADEGRTANEAAVPGRFHSMGADLARAMDYTVITVLDDEGRQVYHERFNQISWERQIAAISEAAGRYEAQVWMDCTGVGDPIYEALAKRGVRVQPFHFTMQSKTQLIDRLAMALENGRLRLMDVPEQTSELLAYQYEMTASRNVRMNAPAGLHDDCVIALALANWNAESTPGIFERVEPDEGWYERVSSINPWEGDEHDF